MKEVTLVPSGANRRHICNISTRSYYKLWKNRLRMCFLEDRQICSAEKHNAKGQTSTVKC